MPQTPKILVLDGQKIHDIPSLYDELNRLFMEDEEWSIGASLDALDDMLYGAYGAANHTSGIELVWKNIEHSKAALGYAATKQFYQAKLTQPEIYNISKIQQDLDALCRGEGKTYFDIVVEIIDSHSNIRLIKE